MTCGVFGMLAATMTLPRLVLLATHTAVFMANVVPQELALLADASLDDSAVELHARGRRSLDAGMRQAPSSLDQLHRLHSGRYADWMGRG